MSSTSLRVRPGQGDPSAEIIYGEKGGRAKQGRQKGINFYSAPWKWLGPPGISLVVTFIGEEEWEVVQLPDELHQCIYANWKVQSKVQFCFRIVFSLFSCT